MRKTNFLLGTATGYVLGARAGRTRYEQIKAGAGKVWRSPKVQQTVNDLEGKAADGAKSGGQQLQGKVASAAKDAMSKGQQKVQELRGSRQDAAVTDYDTAEMPGTHAQAGSNGLPL